MWVYIRCIYGVFKLNMGLYMVYIRCILDAYKVDVGVYKVYIYSFLVYTKTVDSVFRAL